MPASDNALLTFPCDFPIKVMGHAAADFDSLVLQIVSRHVQTLREGAVQRRPSKQGTYVSLTVTVRAENQVQLDNLYRDLSGHPRILLVL